VADVDLRLSNGTDVVIRPIRSGDKALLAAGVARLSPHTARMRFLGPKSRLTTAELRYLTEIDYVDHYALVAVRADDPHCLAGVGRWVRDAGDRHTAELAILVADGLQGQGLGMALAEALSDAARARGIARFTGITLAENTAAHRLFAHLSSQLQTRHQGSTYEMIAELAAQGSTSAVPLARSQRCATR
jgi:protein lysine acetyltransferase